MFFESTLLFQIEWVLNSSSDLSQPSMQHTLQSAAQCFCVWKQLQIKCFIIVLFLLFLLSSTYYSQFSVYNFKSNAS